MQYRDNTVEIVRKRILVQWRNDQNTLGIVLPIAETLQELEDVIYSLRNALSIEDQEGANLDVIGSIVGEERLGKRDEKYRLFLRARALINKSSGKIPEIIEILKTAFQADSVIVREPGVFPLLVVEIDMSRGAIPLSSIEMEEYIDELRAGGVPIEVINNADGIENAFSFSEGDLVEADTQRGFADDAETIGGYVPGSF